MASRYSKSSGKVRYSALHDIFPDTFGKAHVSVSKSITSGVFSTGWPPFRRSQEREACEDNRANQDNRVKGYNQIGEDNQTDRDNEINNNGMAENGQTKENHQMKDMTAMMQLSNGEIAISTKYLEDLLRYEMARVVYGSNYVERVGLGLKETLELCLKIFRGEKIEYISSMNSSHREVTNHANAFLYLLDHFVVKQQPLTESAIKETHSILCNNLTAADAGVLSSKNWGGIYRSISANERAFAGAHEFTKPSEIPKAMKSMISNLQADIQNIQNDTESRTEEKQTIDIYQLAAKYCERFVQIHPFRDGNGRTCRLILNVILIRFAGFSVAIGMNESERDEYLFCAQESSRVGGNPEELGKIVKENAVETLERWRGSLVKLRKYLECKEAEMK